VGEALEAFISGLRERLGSRLVKVMLFGSYAKGCADEWSDVDVLVVYIGMERDEATRLVAEAAAQVALRYDVPLEPLVLSLHEYLEETLFTREVKKTGKILYSINPGLEARELAYDYLHLATRWLEYSKEVQREGKGPRSVIDAAYNAAELAIKALVILKGETLAKTHGGLLSQFGRLYVRVGIVDRRYYQSYTMR